MAKPGPGLEEVYATLLLTDSYLPGALVLAHSLRDAGTRKKLAVFLTIDSVAAESITQLRTVFDYIIPVPRIRNERRANLYLMNRPDLDSAFSKINLWKHIQFSRIVYIDADVVAYRAPDELFALEHAFAASPDIGWPDVFNTGVMVLSPNLGDYYAMIAMADRGISFDGADQGLLNMYFKNSVHRLPFTYNVTPSGHYQYVPAYLHFQSSISMVHFIGSSKPWFEGRGANCGSSPYDEMVGRWWAVYDRHYRPQKTITSLNEDSTAYIRHFIRGEFIPAYQQTDQTDRQLVSEDSRIRLGASHLSPKKSPLVFDSGPTNVDVPLLEPVQVADTTASAEKRGSQGDGAVLIETQEVTTNSWDAQRQPPPADSRPEAVNFPSTHYEMSQDVTPFVAPDRYPSPPKNMWYEVPKERPLPSSHPRAIFPWEGHQPQPSRAFPSVQLELKDPTGVPHYQSTEHAAESASTTAGTLSTENTAAADQGSTTPTILVTPSDVWTSYQHSNAWDSVPGINKYVEGLQSPRRKGSQSTIASNRGESVAKLSSTESRSTKPKGLKLTDFPSEIDRPSLPVTPAPIRGPSFWGDDTSYLVSHDSRQQHQLPNAPGVPTQSDWDPAEQLQKLAKHQSDELLRRLGGEQEQSPGVSRNIPSRSLPFGSDVLKPSAYVLQSSPAVISPKPVKAEATTDLLHNIVRTSDQDL